MQEVVKRKKSGEIKKQGSKAISAVTRRSAKVGSKQRLDTRRESIFDVTMNTLKSAGVIKQEMPDDVFYVKGPMGKGLQMAQKGIHVAFCAGTGALIFLDLVAYLLIKNSFKKLSKIIPENMKQLYDDFEFHLYCSWEDRDQAIGLEIMEMLEKVNDRLGMTNFKLVTRFSKVKEGE